jgi:hypothetical protein
VIFVITGLALGYAFLTSIGAVGYARDTLRYYWGCPSGEVMTKDMGCVSKTFWNEAKPVGERR